MYFLTPITLPLDPATRLFVNCCLANWMLSVMCSRRICQRDQHVLNPKQHDIPVSLSGLSCERVTSVIDSKHVTVKWLKWLLPAWHVHEHWNKFLHVKSFFVKHWQLCWDVLCYFVFGEFVGNADSLTCGVKNLAGWWQLLRCCYTFFSFCVQNRLSHVKNLSPPSRQVMQLSEFVRLSVRLSVKVDEFPWNFWMG